MKAIITIQTAFFLFMYTCLIAQDNKNRVEQRPLNSIQINLLGDASIISINYEKQFLITPTVILSSKLGLGYNKEIIVWGGWDPDKYLTIPHHITANFGKGIHLIEIGLGGTVLIGNTTQPYILYPIVGYRLMPLKAEKVNLRIFGQVPFTGLETDDIYFVPFGLSLGVSF